MKNLITILLLSLTALGCNLLDQKSPNDILSEEVFTTSEGAENALTGLYSTLQDKNYYGGQYILFTEAYAGIATTGGYDFGSLDEFGTQTVTSQNLYCEATYIAIYRCIANANRLIDGIEKIPANEFGDGRKARIIGEARFVRAMAHFDLLRWFGYYWDKNSADGIAIVDHVTESTEIIPRATVNDTYKFVIAELEAIRNDFPDDEEHAINYISRSTIEALLARICIYSKDYNGAYTLSSAVLAKPAFSLFRGTDVAKIYDDRSTPEGIFELAFDIRNQSSFNSATYGKPDALRPELLILAAENLKTFFENRPDDTRAALLDFVDNDESILPDGRTQKYRGESTRDNPAFVLRTAEMYLVRAEANFRLGNANAWDDLNALREARGLGALIPADATNEDEFTSALLDEIKAEFNFEGHYLFNLVRLGRFESELGLDAFRKTFPIPEREVAATGGTVHQNPGY